MPDIDRATAIMAEEIAAYLPLDAAAELAVRIVGRLDDEAAEAARERTTHGEISPGDIVQCLPEVDTFAGALLVVTEPRSWGVIGYVQVPGGGQAYRRCAFREFEHTGGRAPFIPEHQADRISAERLERALAGAGGEA